MDTDALQCIICPGQPDFSDVSHLLTHVASKAHLSHYFKLQVRSHQELQALELLDEYDHWYKVNNLAQMLSDRMTAKDARKKKAQGKTSNAHVPPARKQTHRTQPVEPSPRPTGSILDFLDPRLAGSSKDVKNDPETADVSFLSPYSTLATAAATDAHVTPRVNAAMCPKQPSNNSKSNTWPQVAYGSGTTLPVTPKRPQSGRIGEIPFDEDSPDPFVDRGGRSRTLDDAEVDKARAEEMARLKGVLWPGMDVFDSATQQMRRKRNQRKDSSVLKRMEATSLLVEPTELVFSPTGILRKQRVISGNVEDDSPLKGETPIPKRRPVRPKRGILRQGDPNVLRAQDRKRTRRAGHQGFDREADESDEETPGSPRPFRRLAGLNPSYAGDDGEFGLSAQAFGTRPRSAFTIFADEDRDKTNFKDQRLDTKLQLGTLTPARLFLDRKSDISGNHGSHTDHASLGKENIEPILNPQGRIDNPWHSPFSKRRDSVDTGYMPRYFSNEPSSVGFGAGDDHEKGAYRSNPLLAPSSKLAFYDNSGWPTMSYAASSEETISEDDQHDFSRLYLDSSAD
ncbi:hypothetical protein NUU61_006920 [Penicillium alfredii]|uniref:Uncharacterized protein n=1 Tax=Penicillium alfredii TaxID=1506179 RepID=A0A9W9F240_9EURO|nr:uncharacterized protein NUU61_006920 [Penicillium alfredii]KAJ5092050.1 hypothetical protein NUU61_006920 [Penicillium alfredii]